MIKVKGWVIIFMCLIQLALPEKGEMKSKADISRTHNKMNTEWEKEHETTIQETKDVPKVENNKINAKTEPELKSVKAREKEIAPLSSNNILYHFSDKMDQIQNRVIRSKIGFDNSLESQFERNCRSVGGQPCTCYYPDHIEVFHFEVGNDNITKKALMNGTGPANCSDLKVIGHTLRGFYLVLLTNNTKRAKPVYCDFNQTSNSYSSYSNQVTMPFLLNQNEIKVSAPRRLRFCGGLASQQCTFYYSDYPDALQFQPRSSNTEPTSCEDLKSIGHFLNGYYMVRFNGIKVKTVYCSFKPTIIKKDENKMRRKRVTQKNSTKIELCDGVGSQPCSCYQNRFLKIQQLELSSDEITRLASSESGEGPTSCNDYGIIGHTLKGFYIVRSNGKIMKTVFCEFELVTKSGNKRIISKEISTERIQKSSVAFSTPVSTPKTRIPFQFSYRPVSGADTKKMAYYPKTKLKDGTPIAFSEKPLDHQDCHPIGYFKTKPDHRTCLVIQMDRRINMIELGRVIHKTCKGDSIERWTWINRTNICNIQKKNCLTLSSHSNWKIKSSNNIDLQNDLYLELTKYDPSNKYQQWKVNQRNGFISSVGEFFAMCLASSSSFTFPDSVITPLILEYDSRWQCPQWSFIPILDSTNRTVCYDNKYLRSVFKE